MMPNLQFLNARPHFIACIVGAVLAVWAMDRHPYGFYIALRGALFMITVSAAMVSLRSSHSWTMVPMAVIAVLYNPIVPIQLTRQIWQGLNLLTAVALIGVGIVVSLRSRNADRDHPRYGGDGA